MAVQASLTAIEPPDDSSLSSSFFLAMESAPELNCRRSNILVRPRRAGISVFQEDVQECASYRYGIT